MSWLFLHYVCYCGKVQKCQSPEATYTEEAQQALWQKPLLAIQWNLFKTDPNEPSLIK